MPDQNDSSTEARQINAYTIEVQKKEPGKERQTTFFHFPNNPLSVTVAESARVTPQQTLKGHYLEEWGPGFKNIKLEGHTGFSPRSPLDGVDEQDGYEAFTALKKLYRDYLDTTKANLFALAGNNTEISMILHIWEEDEHWRIVPSGNDALRRSRNDKAPLLFYYDMSFIAYADARNDGTDQLGQDFMNGPSMGTVLSNLAGKDNWLGKGIAIIGDGASGFMKTVRGVMKTVRGVIKSVQGVMKIGINAVKGMVNAVKSVVKDITGIMKDISKVGDMARQGISDISKSFREIRCSFQHWLNWANGLISTNYGNEALNAFHNQFDRRC